MLKRRCLGLVSFVFLLLSLGLVGASSCGYVNTDLTLDSDVSSTGTCFTINTSNIVLDCAGHKINYSTAGIGYTFGINNSGGYDNVTIRNCNIYEGNVSGDSKYGVYFKGVDESWINDNNITTIGGHGHGIFLNDSSNNSFVDLNIDNEGSFSISVYLENSEQNTFNGFSFSTGCQGPFCSYVPQGIQLIGDSTTYNSFDTGVMETSNEGVIVTSADYNTFNKVNITSLGSGESVYSAVILEQNASFNNFSSCRIISNGEAVEIEVYNTSNNTFENCYLEHGFGGYEDVVHIHTDAGTGNKFLNDTFNQTADYSTVIYIGGGSTLVENSDLSSEGTTFESMSGVVHIEAGSGSVIKGNNIFGSYQNKVYVTNSAGTITFDNNYFGDSSGDAQASTITLESGRSETVTLVNNVFVDPKINSAANNPIEMTDTTFRAADNTLEVDFPSLSIADNLDFNESSNFFIDNNMVAIDPTDADLSTAFNTTANITFHNIDCLAFSIYYDSSFVNNYATLTSGTPVATQDNIGGSCNGGVCTNIACSGGTLTMTVPSWSSFGAANATSCGYVNSDVILTADVSSTGTCFTINTSNIVLDCAGHKINYSTNGTVGYSVYDNGYGNVTIKNCNIYEGNATTISKFGIYLLYSDNSLVDNTNITTIGGDGDGIHLSGINNITINKVNITTLTNSGSGPFGIDCDSNNVSINNTYINILGSTGGGIFLGSNTKEASIKETHIKVSSGNKGMYLSGANNTLVKNVEIMTLGSGGYGIYLESSSGDNIFTNINVGAGFSYSLKDDTGNGSINYLIYNNSYGKIKWTNTSDGGFLKDMDINGSIALGTNLSIGNNTAFLNASAFSSGINSSANITFHSVSYSGTDYYNILKDGVVCSDCVKIGYNPVKFQVKGFSNYTTQGTTPPAVPEFSNYAVLLILVVVGGGFLFMKKRR